MRYAAMALTFAILGCGDVGKVGPVPVINEVKIKTVKWVDVEQAIAAHKGRVVVVDVWADFCGPCKKKFPKMLALQGKYRDKGLVVISVSLDNDDDSQKALAFLKRQDARIENYLLDESAAVIEDKVGGTAIPIAIVYGRDGQRKKLFQPDPDANAQFEVEDVENEAVKQLKN